ncbi:fungal-specific transcription factor domain-containing protein [Crepidotus variabilis]|uniref:Fungal-specific transcription factor domain-containing protein n=1 Tax=Crepidotus variabilis TaxID=179855 RepID=A0A9P6JMP8_9AGAR|nr:fungal-specific transcription factor domain-containing protein [Crepidotus variabilis]
MSTNVSSLDGGRSFNLRQDDDLDFLEGSSQAKKPRRAPGACDNCKRKKVRCDSTQTTDNFCTNCKISGVECTHNAVGKSLGAAKGYVESLEARLEKMDKLLTTLLPGIDFNQELEKLDQIEEPEPDLLPRNDGERTDADIATGLDRLRLNPQAGRFFGKSSHIQLIQTALDMKEKATGEPYYPDTDPGEWRREGYWGVPSWTGPEVIHDQWAGVPTYEYPPPSLMNSLIGLYFTNMNPYMPLLHRPSFEQLVTQGLHRTDRAFGATVLLVCAIGAKYSDDVRVLVDGTDSWLSAGWKYHQQVKLLRVNTHEKTSLYELQAYALHGLFSWTSPVVQGVWVELGLGLKLAVEVGAHRKRPMSEPSIEDELWKRAFWVLFTLERRMSAFAGRGCSLFEEDIDVDLPAECDDENWNKCFQQPSEVPSSIAYFNCYLRLMQILGQAMRFIYSVKRPRNLFYTGTPRSDHELIAELDSMMNKWMDSVPDHLKWHLKQENELFRRQSAFLHASYYYLQIFIHRPFVPSPRNPTPSNFPSLAICTNAARSCCHVLETFHHGPVLPLTFEVTFAVGVVLLLNIWSGKRSGSAPNPKRELESVSRCVKMLESTEERWSGPGRFKDILQVLFTAGGVEATKEFNSIGNSCKSAKKRLREDTAPIALNVESPESSGSTPPCDYPRSVAGTRRASRNLQNHSSPTSSDELNTPAPNYLLPTSTNELARLPIYGQFNFLDSTSPGVPISPSTIPSNNSAIDTSNQQFYSNYNTFSRSASSLHQYVDGGVPYNHQPAQPAVDMLNYDSLFRMPLTGQGPAESTKSQPTLDAEMMAMWSTAPTNLLPDDWTMYLSNVNQLSMHQSSIPCKQPHFNGF